MTPDQAMIGVGRLVGGTPGPWTEASVQTYADEMVGWNGPHAGEVLDQVCRKLVAEWDSDRRPSLQDVRERWARAMAIRTPVLPPSTNTHCDGTGWRINQVDEMVPCPRCNGALAAVFDDPVKLDRWSHGAQLDDLDVGVERTKAGMRYIDRRDPVHCTVWQEEPVSPSVGIRAAWNAYATECAEQGRDPAKGHFAQWVAKPRTTPVAP